MQNSRSSMAGRPARRLVLAAAFAIGLAAALAPHTEVVLAAGLAPALVVAQGDTSRAGTLAAPGATPTAPNAAGATPRNSKSTAAADSDADADADTADTSDEDTEADATSKSAVTVDTHDVVIQKGGKQIRIQGMGHDREYDSFEQFVQDAPWLAGLVFLTVLLVFLVPLLIIVLLIWYKMRKNRMANETMLKLAERGIVPPAAAMEAVASGTAAASVAAAAAPASAPAYEHARSLQRRVVWSDLRKGVILTGVGVGLSMYSMFDDGSPNGIGLVVLFVGLGYCLLWFLEDRTTARRDAAGTPPPGGA